jgi:hypothetical protein
VVRVNGDTTGQITLQDDNPESFAGDLLDVGLDTSLGIYFALTRDTNGTTTNLTDDRIEIVRGSIAGGGVQVAFDIDAVADLGTDALVRSLTVDAASRRIFVGIQDFEGTASENGIRVFSYDQAGNVTDGGWLLTSTSSNKPANGSRTDFNALDLDYDRVANQLYFTDISINANGPSQNIFKVDVANPNVLIPLVTNATFSDFAVGNGDSGRLLGEVEVDSIRGRVFFSTYGQGQLGVTGYNAAQNHVYVIGTNGGTPVEVALTATDASLLAGFRPERLAFDEVQNQLYVQVEGAGGLENDADDRVLVFQIAADGRSGSLIGTINPGITTTNQGFSFSALSFNQFATFSAGSGTFVEGGAATPLFASPVVSDRDNGFLTGAVVQISAGLNAAADRLIYVNGNGINGVYNTGNGTLTLSGYASTATYQSAIASIRFSSSGDNPTSTGATRTITTTISDGSVGVPAGSTNTTTTTINVVGVNDAPVIGGITVAGDSVA